MTKHGTASSGLYVEFQAAVLRQLPRPEELDASVLDGWLSNQAGMQRGLRGLFLPPEEKPAPAAIVVPEPTITPYAAITVDYGMNLEAMVKVGRYDGVNPDITAEHFPIVGDGKVDREPLLVHFGRDMDDAVITTEFDRLGLRDGAIEELAAFGAKYPDLQRGYPIIGRQSVWRYRVGYSYCPCLLGGGRERILRLTLRGLGWDVHCRFLAFRK